MEHIAQCPGLPAASGQQGQWQKTRKQKERGAGVLTPLTLPALVTRLEQWLQLTTATVTELPTFPLTRPPKEQLQPSLLLGSGCLTSPSAP